jgi:hypothetical protein
MACALYNSRKENAVKIRNDASAAILWIEVSLSWSSRSAPNLGENAGFSYCTLYYEKRIALLLVLGASCLFLLLNILSSTNSYLSFLSISIHSFSSSSYIINHFCSHHTL